MPAWWEDLNLQSSVNVVRSTELTFGLGQTDNGIMLFQSRGVLPSTHGSSPASSRVPVERGAEGPPVSCSVKRGNDFS